MGVTFTGNHVWVETAYSEETEAKKRCRILTSML